MVLFPLLPLSLSQIALQWKSQGFDPTGQILVLAVSGGADSVAMLRFFVDEVVPTFQCSLKIGHVQHGLRPAAEGDAEFVQKLSDSFHLECRIFRLNPDTRHRRESLEAWARRERYAALTEWSATARAFLLTAHHRDDWIETVLLRLSRGENWRAFLGMPFRREPGIVRPFLSLPGARLRSYLQDLGQAFCLDESNDQMRFTRNHFRHQLLPNWDRSWLATEDQNVGSDWRERLWRFGQQMQAMQPWLETLQPNDVGRDSIGNPFLAAESVENLLSQGEGEWVLRRLRALVSASGGPPGLPKKTFLRGFEESFQNTVGDGVKTQLWTISPKWQLKRESFFGEEAKYRVEPTFEPGDSQVTSMKAGIEAKQGCIQPAIEIILDALPGEWDLTMAGQPYRLRVTLLSRMTLTGFPAAQEDRVVCDASRFSSTLVLRTRQAGDRFSPLGTRSRSRKLKAYLNEKEVPASQRNSLPLVFTGGDLVWVPGYGLSEWFKVTPQTETLYEMVLECQTTMIPLKTRTAT